MLLTFEDPPANIKVREKFLVRNSRDTQTSRAYFGLEPVLQICILIVIRSTLLILYVCVWEYHVKFVCRLREPAQLYPRGLTDEDLWEVGMKDALHKRQRCIYFYKESFSGASAVPEASFLILFGPWKGY